MSVNASLSSEEPQSPEWPSSPITGAARRLSDTNLQTSAAPMNVEFSDSQARAIVQSSCNPPSSYKQSTRCSSFYTLIPCGIQSVELEKGGSENENVPTNISAQTSTNNVVKCTSFNNEENEPLNDPTAQRADSMMRRDSTLSLPTTCAISLKIRSSAAALKSKLTDIFQKRYYTGLHTGMGCLKVKKNDKQNELNPGASSGSTSSKRTPWFRAKKEN